MQILVRFRAFGVGAFAAGTLFAAAAMADTYSKVTTFAGDPGTNNTIFKEPAGVIAMPAGELLVADARNDRLVRVSPNGAVLSVVGSGKPGSKDGGAAAAEFKEPRDLARFGDVIYVADSGNDRIRTVTMTGTVSTLAVTGLKRPSGLAVDAAGNLYVADSGHDVIRKLTPAGVMTVVAGVLSESDPDRNNEYTDGPALQATFDEPLGLAMTPAGVLYIVDSKNDAIRKLENGVVSTVAGGKRNGFADGPALTALFDRPTGIALDDAGNLLVADTKNERIRKVTLGASPSVSTIAGTGASGLVDGAPAGARFKGPAGLVYAGALFVCDSQNQVIRALYQTVAVTSVTPPSGTAGTQVRVRGSGFVLAQTTVTFGTTAATAIAFVNGIELLVTVPTLGPGRYDVTVTTPAGSATLPAAFTQGSNDTDLPGITAAVAPLPNAAGWNNTAVRVTFTCADATSGIASCSAPVDVVADTAAQTVTGTAVDNAGNQNSVAVTVRIDKGAPAITSAVTPAPNARGWTNADTTVRFNATDALSGVATVTPPATITTDTAGQQFTGRATDVAGNAAETSVTVKLDKTAPAATATATPAPHAAGWHNANVAVTFSGTDALSGVLTTDPPQTVSAEGTQTVTGSVTDAAGNSAQASATVKIDKTAPTATATSTPAPNAAGWNNTDVVVTFGGTDALSGVAATGSPQTVSVEGTQTVTGNVTDAAGNTATATATLKLDKTQPLLTLDPLLGPSTVYAAEVTISGTASDTLSGLTAITCDGVPAAITGATFQCTVTLPRGAHDVAVVALDAAGNAATATRAYVLADDTTAPLIVAAATDSLTDGWTSRPVAVFFECADGETGIAVCPPPVTLHSEGAGQVATGTAVDKAGNSAQASLTVAIDMGAPVVTLDALPAGPTKNALLALAGSASDALSGLTRVACNGAEAVVSGGRFTCGVPLFPGRNDVVVEAYDRARNETRTAITVQLDTSAPTVEIGTPAPGSTTGGTTVTVTGTAFDDDQLSGVTVNGAAASLAGDSFSATIPVADGDNAIAVVATDRAGNISTAGVTITRAAVPVISILEPADLLVTNTSAIDVRGTVSGATAVTVDGIPAVVSGGFFTAADVPLAQGRTVITAMATSAGAQAATTSVNVYRDSIPPRVVLRSPADGAVVTQSPIAVTGMVDDIVVGTINAGQVRVTVNGVTAEVMNRAFIARGIALAAGQNTLLITATDQGENTTNATARVTYTPASGANRLTIVSGDAQQAAIGSLLPAPLVVRLTDGGGAPLAGRTVQFRVVENNGTLAAGDQSGRSVTAATDADGRATVTWTLGMRAGAGNQRVAASSGGATAELVAVGTFGAPHLVVVDSGNGQISAVAAELPRPLVAVVVDAGSNRLANVPVTFSALSGGGSFGGQPSITVQTDSDGRAIVRPTLGPEPGRDNNAFLASVAGVSASATFFATGLIPGDPANTRITGVVLDNSDIPIPGVSVRIEGTALVTQSDSNGYFTLTGVPVGYVKLFVDGSTATRPGSWPMLEYAMYTVPGAENTLGMPVYLLPLDTARGIAVSETIGGTLTLPELPGFSLSIAPGAATFPGGARTGTVSVTLVHADKMPMPPGFGQQPRFIVTIQPPGVHFDPPAAMTLPNVDGLAPGEVTEMYSFDHDLGQFVAIGTASASDDGSVIRSDPGVGIIKGGWHCGGNPAASGTSGNCGYCGTCSAGGNCVPNPARAGQPCPNDGIACTEDICRDGQCRHIPITIRIGGITTGTRNIYVDRDDPSRTLNDAQNLQNGQPVYSNDSAGDLVAWRAHIDNVSMRSRVTQYQWRATGPETHDGPAASEWMVGTMRWKPGTYTITLKITFNNGCVKTATYTQRVGIRTNDYILYGSILAFPPPTAGVNFTTTFRWSCFNVALVPSLLLAAFTPIDFNNPLSGLYTPEEWPDRLYANYQLLNLTANTPPNPTRPHLPKQYTPIVINTEGGASYELPQWWVAGVSPTTGYRQAVRAQFRYLVTDDGRIVWPPTPIEPVFSIAGQTTPPCEPTNAIPGPDGVGGDRNGKVEPDPDGTGFGYIMQIRAGHDGQTGFAKLNRRELPNVYFRMRFKATDGKIHTNTTRSSDSPDGPDQYDYCSMPSYFLYQRVWLNNPGEYGMLLQPGYPIYQDLEKFLRISKKILSTGGPYYPPD